MIDGIGVSVQLWSLPIKIITWHRHSFIRTSWFREKNTSQLCCLCLPLVRCSHIFGSLMYLNCAISPTRSPASSSDVRWWSEMAFFSETGQIFESATCLRSIRSRLGFCRLFGCSAKSWSLNECSTRACRRVPFCHLLTRVPLSSAAPYHL